MGSNGTSKNDQATQDAPKATFSRKVQNFDGFGDHWKLNWVIFRSFWERLGHTKAAKNTIERVCKTQSSKSVEIVAKSIQKHVGIHAKIK